MLELLAVRLIKLQRAVKASNQIVNNTSYLIMHLPDCEDGSVDLMRSFVLEVSALGTFASPLLCWPIIYLQIICSAERAHPSPCSHGKAKYRQENATSAMKCH